MQTEEITKQLLEYLKSTEAFITEQAPLIAKEILNYGWVDSMIGLCVCVVIMLISAGVVLFYSPTDINYINIPVKVVAGWICFLFLMMSFSQATTLVKIKTAPRLYIIDQLKKRG